MDNRKIGFRLLKQVMEDWKWRRLDWREIKYKYGIGKTSFYKYRKRFFESGDEGLKELVRKKPVMPHALGCDQKEKILNYVYENPTHGPDRIASELKHMACAKTVWNFLKKEGLNIRRKRRLWVHYQGRPILTEKEKLHIQAKNNHIESYAPAELISMDTFWLNVKSVGKVYQYTACDTYSSFGWAKLYAERTSDNSIDFIKSHMLKRVPPGKIRRILTDQGTEFYSARNRDKLHSFTGFLLRKGIMHSVTKVAHPWTNGYAERLNQTIWQEFYLCRLARPYTSIDDLNEDLKNFMTYYNWKRIHSGYKLKELGSKFPGCAFYDLNERYDIAELKELIY